MSEGPDSPATVPGAMLAALPVAAIAILVHLCSSFGLLALAPLWTTPVLIGGVTALVSRRPWAQAAWGTAAGAALGAIVARPWFLAATGDLGTLAVRVGLFALLAAAAAGGTAYLVGRATRRERTELIAAAILVAAILAGMWTTTVAVDAGALGGAENSLDRLLSERPALGATPEDHDIYLRLFYDVHDGRPYYDSFARVFASQPGGSPLPVGVVGYRLPTVFYLWLLPPDGAALPAGFLVFASLAVVSSFAVGAQLGRPGTAVLGALFVGVAYLLPATTTWVTFVDGWGMALTLAGTALFVASERRSSRRLVWTAVAAFLAGAVMREMLVYPMVLACATALLLPPRERWHAAWPWLAGLGAFAGAYLAHALAIGGRVVPGAGYGFWMRGGVGHLMATLEFFGQYFGGKPWLLPSLVIAGVAGALAVRGGQRRVSVFLTAAIVAPLASFLILGNGGQETATGGLSGYWGMLVVPIALALAPLAIDRGIAAADSVPPTGDAGRSGFTRERD